MAAPVKNLPLTAPFLRALPTLRALRALRALRVLRG